MRISDILSGTKKRLSRNSRKRRTVQPDNLYKITGYQLTEASKGREINHIEDLVIFFGSQGANKAINSLHQLEQNPKNITIKWDGRPAVIFGRNDKGEFVLTDKSGFGAKGYDGRVTSADSLEKMFLNRPNGNTEFAAKMKNIWNAFEQSTPQDFRGYVHGDLLYFTTPQIKNGAYEFTPNTTSYMVDVKSDIGSKIGNSKTGVVIHGGIDLDGNKTGPRMDEFTSGDLLILPPQSVSKIEQLDISGLKELETFVKRVGNDIDQAVNPPAELKISDFKDNLYAYMNYKAKSGSMDDIGPKGFLEWLQSSKVSKPKQTRTTQWVMDNAKGVDAVFQVMRGLITVKNNAIQELDQQQGDIRAYTAGQPGGEGYVIGKDVKLVNRLGFSAANFARNA